MTTLEKIKNNIGKLLQDINEPISAGTVNRTSLKKSIKWYNALKKGYVFFYENKKVKIGLKNIDWSGSHIKHQEWPAQLNRFSWLAHLSNLYKATKDPEIPSLARRTIEDWIDNHEPYSADKPLPKGDNTLNLSIRIGQADRSGWWHAAAAFCGSKAFDEAFVQRMLETTHCQIESLKAHLAPTINWRISHLNCMLFCSLVLPGFEKYKDFAVLHLNEAFYRQVDPDGSHVEHCPSSYHQWMMRVFSSLVYLAKARPQLGFNIDPAIVAKMWDYAVYSSTPDGGSSGLHDGARWKPSAKNTLLKERERYLAKAGLRKKEFDISKQPCRFFPYAGHLFLRDSWKENVTYISVDAVRYGGGHNHLSKLAVNLYSGKRMLLCDPGIFTYESSDPSMAYGKSTVAHNTVTLHDYNQAETNPEVLDVSILKNFALFCGVYAGSYFSGPMYWGFKDGTGNAEYGAHERVVFWVKGSYLLVFDLIKADHTKEVPYQIHWQFPEGGAHVDKKNNAAWTIGTGDNVLVRNIISASPLTTSIHKGEENPMLGWLPTDHAGGRVPAPHCLMEGLVKGGYSLSTTLIMPFKGKAVSSFEIREITGRHPSQQAFEIVFKDGTRDIIAEMPTLHRMIGECGKLFTDGALAFLRLDKHGKIRKAFLGKGSRLEFDGKTVICKTEYGFHELDC